MKALILILALVSTHDRTIEITSTESGVVAADLADTPVMNPINMEATRATNQLSLTVAVTPGTSLVVVIKCFESQEKTSGYGQISFCDTSSPAACVPDDREFTLADYPLEGTVKNLPSRWPITKKWVKCSVDDPADGDGTATVTGARSWR